MLPLEATTVRADWEQTMAAMSPLLIGSDDDVWAFADGVLEARGLGGRAVTHLAARGDDLIAAVPADGLYRLRAGQAERIWDGDARACAIGPDGTPYVGIEPAMIHRRDPGGIWRRCDAIDALPSRGDWTYPPPPHEPHVLAIDFSAGLLVAGIEVGGVIVSSDRGERWEERNAGLYVDVHSVRPDPSEADALYAVTGAGFYASRDAGRSWRERMAGVRNGYTIGLSVHPERAGALLIAAGARPPGREGRLYRSDDGGETWAEIRDPALPESFPRAPVPLLTAAGACIGTDEGRIFQAEEAAGRWRLVAELRSAINCMVVAGGSPSSVMH